MSNPSGSRPALALGAGLALVIVLRADPGLTFAVAVVILCAFAATLSAGTSRRMGAAIGILTWALADGFVENRYGELSWHGGRDLVLLAALVGTALVASSIYPSRWTASRVEEI